MEGLDGVEHLVGGIYADRLDIDGSHLMTNVNLWPRPLVLVAGARSYGRLTAEQRRILRTAAANVVPKALTVVRNAEAEASGNICRRGGATFDAATSSELRALRLAVEPVYRDLERDPGTRAAIEAIERHKAELAEPPADLASCERTAEPPASGATAIDGVWRMDTDREAVGLRTITPRTGDAGPTCSTAAGSRSRRRTATRAPGATGPSPSTATGCRGPSRTAAASPRPAPRTSPASSSSSASAPTATR